MSPPLRTGPDRVWRWQRSPASTPAASIRQLRTGSALGRAAQGRRARRPAGTISQGAGGAAGAAGRSGHPRSAAPATVAERHVRRLRARPERRHQPPARGAGRLSRLAALHPDGATTRLPLHCAGRRWQVDARTEVRRRWRAESAPTGMRSTAHAATGWMATAHRRERPLVVAAASWLLRRDSPGNEAHRPRSCRSRGWPAKRLAGIRSGWRTGRFRLVRREVRQYRHLRHAGRLQHRPASDHRSGRRLRAELVARRATHRLPSSSRPRRAYSCHFGVRRARFNRERFSGWRHPVGLLISVQIHGRPMAATSSRAAIPSLSAGDPAGLYLIPSKAARPRAITRPNPPTFHFSPVFSPDGRRMAYASATRAASIRHG